MTTKGRVGWLILVVLSVVAVLNHAIGAFTFAEVDPEPMMFALFAGLNLYATVVLLIPYRRGEMWAWLVTWAQVGAVALPFFLVGGDIGMYYLVGALVMAVAQAATYPEFAGVTSGGETR